MATEKQSKLVEPSERQIHKMEKRRNELIITGVIELENEYGICFFDFLSEKEQEEFLKLDKALGYNACLDDDGIPKEPDEEKVVDLLSEESISECVASENEMSEEDKAKAYDKAYSEYENDNKLSGREDIEYE